jgi:predicted TIM-barrel fold metal-dependent hydrolase
MAEMTGDAAPAIDCHAHIIDPARFPYVDGPGYKPPPSEYGDAHAFSVVLGEHGMDGALLVQPSCYGTDNRAMLSAIGESGGRLKGVAVVPPGIADPEIERLKAAGVVGVRVNLGSYDPTFFERPEAAAFLVRMAAADLHVEVYAVGDGWARIAAPLAASGAKLVIDHFGHPDVSRDIGQPGFQAVLELARSTPAVVKLSSAFRVSAEPFPHGDVRPFVESAVAAFGVGRCLWGSDWPFVSTEQTVRYGEQRSLLEHWLPDPHDREMVLRTNPARCFGFGPGAGSIGRAGRSSDATSAAP